MGNLFETLSVHSGDSIMAGAHMEELFSSILRSVYDDFDFISFLNIIIT